MKHSGPTIMLHFSITQLVDGLGYLLEPEAAPARRALWLEIHGDTVTSNWEHWSPLAPDIWLATSKKK